MQARN